MPAIDAQTPEFLNEDLEALVRSSTLPASAERLRALADACGVGWIVSVSLAHPALMDLDALPPQLAYAVFRDPVPRACLMDLLVDSPLRHTLEAVSRPAAMKLYALAREVFATQLLRARQRRENDSPPVPLGLDDPLLGDVVKLLCDTYRSASRSFAPVDPNWIGRTRFREMSQAAVVEWEALPYGFEQGPTLRARLDLERWREGVGAVSFVSSDGSPPWFFLRLLNDVIGMFRDIDRSRGVRLAAVKRTFGVAPWERFVAAIDAVFEPPPIESVDAEDHDERVIWIVDEVEKSLRLNAKVQKQKSGVKGEYSKGKRVALSTVAEGRVGTMLDAEVADILESGRERTYLPIEVVHDAIERLQSHPLVFDDNGRPLEIRKEPIELSVVEIDAPDSDGPLDLELEVRLGGETMAPRDLYLEVIDTGGTHRFLREAERSVVVLTRPSPRAMALLHALSHLHARFPATEGEALLSRLPRLSNDFAVVVPGALRGEFVPPDLTLVARLHPLRPEGLAVRFGFRPLAQSGLLDPGEGTVEVLATEDGRRVRTDRPLQQEREIFADVINTLPLDGFTARSAFAFASATTDDALDLLSALKRSPQVRMEWPEGVSLDVTRPATTENLRVHIAKQRDWFGVEGSLELDGHQIGLAMLFDALRERRRYIALEGGKYLALSDALRAKATPLAALAFEAKGGIEVGAGVASAVFDLEQDGAHLDTDATWDALQARLRNVDDVPTAVPRALQATLRPYQEDGVRWLLRLAHLGVGGILADDMGLGKTVQALGVLLARRDRPSLVVAPTSVGFNWEREAARFAPSLNVVRYRGKDRSEILQAIGPGTLVVTSYGLMQRDAAELAAVTFGTVVFDEAQALKNASTKAARAARDLQRDWAFALTGTPVENHLGELWSIFRVVSPGLLGSWARFRERYARPIEVDKDRRRQRVLARALSPFLLRRTKREVAPELPSRTEVLLPVTLSGEERTLYEHARLSAVRELDRKQAAESSVRGSGDHRLRLLAALTRLRLCACHPQLLDPQSQLSSSKLAELVALLVRAKASGQRALVFSQFVKLLAFAKTALEDAGVTTLTLQGSTPASARGPLVDRFQAGEVDVFLISLKAGGTGLNLTAADLVVHLDPWWNPAAEAQATDRAHRIGRKRPLTVYRLVASQTIEEEIIALHDDKRALAEGVWDDEEGTATDASPLTLEDLTALLRDPRRPLRPPLDDDDDEP